MTKTIEERVRQLEKKVDALEDIPIIDLNTSIEKIKRMEHILECLGYVILIPNKIKKRNG